MKTLTLKLKMRRICFPLLLVLLLASCSDNESGKRIEKATVNIDLNVYLSLRSAPSTRGVASAYEQKVTSLRVYAFNLNGHLDLMEYVEDAAGLGGNPLLMRMTVITGQKTLCMIANEPSGLKSTLDNINKISDLITLTMSLSDFDFGGVTPLPFASTSGLIYIGTTTNPVVSLSLARAIAKVEMKIIKDSQNPNTVKLVSTQVMNTASMARLMDKNPLNSATFLTTLPIENFGSAIIGSTPATALEMSPHYIFERITGEGNPTTLKSTIIRVALDIDGTIATYDIPLRTDGFNGEKLYDVLRNNYYRLSVTVFPEGISIGYDINEWDDENPWDKEPGKDDTNMQFVDWDENPKYDWELPAP